MWWVNVVVLIFPSFSYKSIKVTKYPDSIIERDLLAFVLKSLMFCCYCKSLLSVLGN